MKHAPAVSTFMLCMAALSGCADAREPAVPPAGPANLNETYKRNQPPRPMPGEDYLYEVEARVPGFGGMYYDDSGDLVVFLKDLRLDAAAKNAIRPHLFGPGKYGRSDGPEAVFKFRQGRYSYVELNDYWHQVNEAVVPLSGVMATDVEETLNRVQVTVRNTSARQAVLDALRRIPVPGDAVHVSTCEPEQIICDDGSTNVGETLPGRESRGQGSRASLRGLSSRVEAGECGRCLSDRPQILQQRTLQSDDV